MTAKYPSIRRRVPASLLNLVVPFDAARAGSSGRGADGAAIDEAAAGTAVAAGQADDDVSRGDVIIVTARRRQETAQEVPVAISVIRGDLIEATGNFNVLQLQQLAPTLRQAYTTNPRNTSVNIRGLGVPLRADQRRLRAGRRNLCRRCLQFARRRCDLRLPRCRSGRSSRGPQGTLYGKNTTAGAINITTNQPTFDFEGRAELSVGNLNWSAGQGCGLRPAERNHRRASRNRCHQPPRHTVQRDERPLDQRAGHPASRLAAVRRAKTSALRCRATTASRTPKVMARRSSALAARSARAQPPVKVEITPK